MRCAVVVKFFATTAGGLLLLASGCGGVAPDENSSGADPGSGIGRQGSFQDQKSANGCETPDHKNPFAFDPAAKPGVSTPGFDNENLPAAVQVDANRNRLLVTRIGMGVQVFDYDRTNGAWVSREPQANLYDIDTGVQQGIHFAGPYWADADGSRVKAKVSGEVEAPTGSERDVTWLRLDAVENFGGNDTVFGQVTFIQRVLTRGGQPPSEGEPTEGCGTSSVPYSALYVFWGQKEQ